MSSVSERIVGVLLIQSENRVEEDKKINDLRDIIIETKHMASKRRIVFNTGFDWNDIIMEIVKLKYDAFLTACNAADYPMNGMPLSNLFLPEPSKNWIGCSPCGSLRFPRRLLRPINQRPPTGSLPRRPATPWLRQSFLNRILGTRRSPSSSSASAIGLAQTSIAAWTSMAAAFVHNPANELLPVPVIREFSVSPIPGVHRPETASPAPPVRPLVKVRWNEDQVARFRLVRPVAAPSCVPLPVAAPPPWAAPPWAGLPAGAQQP